MLGNTRTAVQKPTRIAQHIVTCIMHTGIDRRCSSCIEHVIFGVAALDFSLCYVFYVTILIQNCVHGVELRKFNNKFLY